ncbi:hypothetical protein Vretifemale_7564 [Volvox reticuliferus]|nr:hypothetical protein Vretifemale_7564 [Volvox reticuliferus]
MAQVKGMSKNSLGSQRLLICGHCALIVVLLGMLLAPPPVNAQNKCSKCNVPIASGGCKCDNNCDCRPGLGGNKCDKCNIAVASGGCKCDQNCACITAVSPSQSPSTSSSTVLYSGSSTGTFYYDLRKTCPGIPYFPENNGYPYCASFNPSGATYKTLAQLGTNNVIAIDINVLTANRARLCGKKVLVYKNGNPVSPPDGGSFFVWDGCQACIGGGRLDFSLSGLQNAASNACTLGVVPGISWKVVDEVVQKFIP